MSIAFDIKVTAFASPKSTILGKASVAIRDKDSGSVIVELTEIIISRSNNPALGKFWVKFPSYKDPKGRKSEKTGKDLYWNYYRPFPDDFESHKRLQDAIAKKYEEAASSPAIYSKGETSKTREEASGKEPPKVEAPAPNFDFKDEDFA